MLSFKVKNSFVIGFLLMFSSIYFGWEHSENSFKLCFSNTDWNIVGFFIYLDECLYNIVVWKKKNKVE